ncbi:MAG: hypothetical protein ACRCWJ_13520 [Casimicrobium sp.]
MSTNEAPFDDDLDPPEQLWSEQPIETYRGYHIFDVIHADGTPAGFGVVKDEPDVVEQAPLGTSPFESVDDARTAINEALEMQNLIDKNI